MNSSRGAVHLNTEGPAFKAVIGALALANANQSGDWVREPATPAADDSDLVHWISYSRARRATLLRNAVVSVTSYCSQGASSTATQPVLPSLAPIVDDDPEWFVRELSFWEGDGVMSLMESVADVTAAALDRKLPAELTEEQALQWARELANSLR